MSKIKSVLEFSEEGLDDIIAKLEHIVSLAHEVEGIFGKAEVAAIGEK
ncbi:MAG: hypothetical protein FWH04_03210 [Oscillospiraceae bacterium]|nr:hypothetical protein [Oscillospiraceae bacterium]